MSAEGLAPQVDRAEADMPNENIAPLAMLRAEGELLRFLQPALLAAGYAVESDERELPSLERLQERPPAVFLLQFGVKHNDAPALCRSLRAHPAFSKAAIIL